MKKLLILSLCLFVAAQYVHAQPIAGRTAERLVEKADELYDAGDAFSALHLYEEAHEKAPTETMVLERIARSHYALRDYQNAEKWYRNLIAVDQGQNFPTAQYRLARVMKMNAKYDDAILEFQAFLNNYEGEDKAVYEQKVANAIEGARYARKAKSKEPIDYRNAGRSINTISSETSPYPVGREKVLFASLNTDTVVVLPDADPSQRVFHTYASDKQEEQEGWQAKQLFAPTLEGEEDVHTVNMSYSEDKSRIYFTRARLLSDEIVEGKIYYADVKEDGSFGEPVLLDINSSKYICKNPLSAMVDGEEVLFFTSNQEGGKGGWDIWYVTVNADGTTGTPLNAGDEINTIGDEITPFFQENTLYFSSDGHPSMGGLDIFAATYENGKYAKPENLGPGFNSRVDDFYFVLGREGNDHCHGFLVSNRPGTISQKSETCCDDIFSFILPNRCPIMYAVTAKDQDGKALNGATLRLIDEETGEVLDEQTNVASNTFAFELIRDKKYRVEASKDGYSDALIVKATTEDEIGEITKPVDLSSEVTLNELGFAVEVYNKLTNAPLTGVEVTVFDLNSNSELEKKSQTNSNRFEFGVSPQGAYRIVAAKDQNYSQAQMKTDGASEKDVYKLYLIPLPVFHNIYYDFDKFSIRKEAADTLDIIAKTLNDYPDLVVEVRAHTDALGTDSYNTRLSERRANAAVQYLISKGVDKKRLVPKGFGEAKPIAPNELQGKDNPEGRQKNRRTEFKIVSGLEGLMSDEATSSVDTEKKSH